MKRQFLFLKIVSGGQSGVDRAALDLAIQWDIPHGGWCPKNRYAEDGPITARYQLRETPSEDVNQRTEWNVRDSDGTIIISKGRPTDGTPWTEECAMKYGKPLMFFDMTNPATLEDQEQFSTWVKSHKIETLNIAGPRESHDPGKIYDTSKAFLSFLLCHKK